MDCRVGCGACCIAITIASPLPGLPAGKPAGVPCPHLDAALACTLFGSDARPEVCRDFPAERAHCGDDREQALERLAELERRAQADWRGRWHG